MRTILDTLRAGRHNRTMKLLMVFFSGMACLFLGLYIGHAGAQKPVPYEFQEGPVHMVYRCNRLTGEVTLLTTVPTSDGQTMTLNK